MGRARVSTATPDNADARFAIDQFARWIANADTKAGLLAAAMVILASAIGQQAASLSHRLPPGSFGGWVSLGGLVVAAGAVVASIAFVVRAVTPTVHASDGFSRYSLVSVAGASVAELIGADPDVDREQGWETATLLARIALRKFRNLRRAFRWWAVGALAFLVVVLADLGH
jgi:hypothetical protein